MDPRTVNFWRQAGLALIVLAAALGALKGCEEVPPSEGQRTLPSSGPAGAPAPPANVPAGNGFDFWVLSLSWSPSYCEAEGEDANRQQCDNRRSYGFVVHGLWPQYERGWPENCSTDEPSVDNATLRTLYDIMPSAGLIRHQWRKHGSCSGLSQDDYFRVLREAREHVVIPDPYRPSAVTQTVDPDEVERDFVNANPGLEPGAVAVTCDSRYLREVRICLNMDLAFRPCPEVDRRSCSLEEAAMPAGAGG